MPNTSKINVVSSADNAFAMPLAVTGRSIIDNLGKNRTLALTILDGGISKENKEKCNRSWRDPRVSVRWVEVSEDRLRHLPLESWHAIPTYYRFFIPEILGDEVDQTLYIDCDTLVLSDICRLVETPMGEKSIAAVQDQGCPYFHFPAAMPNFSVAKRWLFQGDPIKNWQQLNIPGSAPHFNAGVMLMNLRRWRELGLTERLLQFCSENMEFISCADQYALNAMLWNDWMMLDNRWNQMQCMYVFPDHHVTALTADEFSKLRSEPWVIHFAGPNKPWNEFYNHPYHRKYFETINRTAWSGYPTNEPSEPPKISPWKSRRRWAKHKIRVLINKAIGRRNAA